MKADNCDFDKAPTFVASIEPDLKIIKVGMPRTPNLAGVFGLSSILIFATFILGGIIFRMSSSHICCFFI